MGKHTPQVSFVVPCYNYARYLGECLRSIFELEGRFDFEVIAIDDGSTDHTPEILKTFLDPRLRVISHSKNQGHVATVNEGLEATRGTFVARIDPDDRYQRCFLTATLPALRQFPDVGLVYGEVTLIDENSQVTLPMTDCPHGGSDFKGNELVALLEKNFICAPAAIARREAWMDALPIPSGLAFNDWYFNTMMARRYDFKHVHQVVADYRVHSANHHSKIVRDKSDEQSVVWLLERIFSEPERFPSLESAKQKAKHRVYAAQYLTLAEKYFGFHMNDDARRCYGKAFQYRPSSFFRPGAFRRWVATWLDRSLYERLKGFVRPAS